MELRLVQATDDDWPRAWAIQRDAFADLVGRTAGGWTAAMERECREEWHAARTRMVVWQGLIGWVRVEHHEDHDWLDLIAIDPAAQGRGLGSTVMRWLMDEARARGVPLWLSVYRENTARRLYARLGFAELPRDEIRVLMVHPATTPLVPPR